MIMAIWPLETATQIRNGLELHDHGILFTASMNRIT